METLTGFVLRHKRLVVLAWLLVALAGVAMVGTATGALSTTFSIPGKAFATEQEIANTFQTGGFDNPPIVLTATAPAGTPVETVVTTSGELFARAIRELPDARLADQATTGGARFCAIDGRTCFAMVFPPADGEAKQRAGSQPSHALDAAPAGWRVGLTGLSQLESASTGGGSNNSALAETLIGALGALIVLIFVFRSFLALLPLVIAAITIPTTFLIIYGLTRITSISFIVQYLVALIGLGIAIDYALLIVTRWREHRSTGMENEAAVRAAMTSAGRAVVFSGVTVAISLLALVALPVAFLRGMGVAALFIPTTTVAVAITLLPVLLATVGPALDHPRSCREIHASRFWTGWASWVMRHRYISATAGFAVIVALIIPMFSLKVGSPAADSLDRGGSAHATLSAMEEAGVPNGVLTPIDILTTTESANTTAAQAARIPGVYTVFTTQAGPGADGKAVVEVLPTAEPGTAAGTATLTAIRHAFEPTPGVLGVTGQGATDADFSSAVYGAFPFMLALIGLVTFILLTRAFRSVLLAAKAVIFNLASLGVAYGVLVLVWQQGHGSQGLWSIPATGAVVVYVPLLVFAFLFGLSMDYEVFIVSRIREEFDATGSTDHAVTRGIGYTGRLVTSAALILFLAFLALSQTPETAVKMLATGLGAGILLDAVIIRSLLLPSLIGVLGRWNWWLPLFGARVLGVATTSRSVPHEERSAVASDAH